MTAIARLAAALCLALAGGGVLGAPPSSQCGAPPVLHGHALSSTAASALRMRVAQYRGLTDAELHAAMGHMPADRWIAVTPADRRGAVGVLVLGHGYGSEGDCELVAALRQVRTTGPMAAALGMAMTSADHIAAARAWLEAQGATELVVIPVVSGQSLSLVRQWEHVLGRRPAGAYADVTAATGTARLRWTAPLIESPAFTTIVANAARTASLDVEREEVVLVTHGPESALDTQADAAVLARQGEAVQHDLGAAAVHTALLRDDAPAADRAEAIGALRTTLAAVADRGHRAVVVALPVTSATNWVRTLRRELHGLDYRLAAEGLVNDPAFVAWVQAQL